MSTVRIPAKKTMEPGMSINDIDNIWDYIDTYVEEEAPNVPEACFDDEEDDYDGRCNIYNVSWVDYEDNDWESDYRDAFEDDSEAGWGREW